MLNVASDSSKIGSFLIEDWSKPGSFNIFLIAETFTNTVNKQRYDFLTKMYFYVDFFFLFVATTQKFF